MTRREFYRKLREATEAGTGWRIGRYVDGYVTAPIRSLEHVKCPLCEVSGMQSGIDFIEAGRCLGMSPKDAEDIAAAADGAGHPATRAALLRACGLEETSNA